MKLHPLSVVYRTGNAVVQWAWILFLVGFAVTNLTDGAAVVAAFGASVIGFLVLVALWQVAYYRRYEYDLTEDTFDIDSGVVSRRSREIPYGRIQNVSIERNVLQRALGLAELRLETAGGSGTEAHLRFVSRDQARWLQDELSERKRADSDEDVEPAAGEGVADGERRERRETRVDVLFDVTPRELTVLGLVSFVDPKVIPLVFFALAPFQSRVTDWMVGAGGTALAIAALVAVLVAAFVVTAAVRAAYEVANYYGFTLVRERDELRYDRGLLQQYSGTIPLAKVQALTVTEHVLARRFGYASLSLETAGFSPGEAGGSQAAIPIAPRDRVLGVAREIEPFDVAGFERPPSRARQRYVVRYAAVVLATTALVYGLLAPAYWIGPWYWPLAGLAIAPVAAHLKWRNLGYALTDDYVVTRHGFWRRTTKIVPYHRVQTVADTQTIFQRRRRLATLHVDVAGSQSLVSDDSRAIDVDRDVAADLRETIAERMLADLESVEDRPEDHWQEPAAQSSGPSDDRPRFGGADDSSVPGPD